MITLAQIVEKVLRLERMAASSCPWRTNFAYTGAAPADLLSEQNRVFYETIKMVDRRLRMRLFKDAPRMLLERATFSVGPTEKPFPVPHMGYIALVLDSNGRRVPVVSSFSQPELNRARYKALGYTVPLADAPFRLVITRPGYWKISPRESDETLTVNFIREHGIVDWPIGYDEGGASVWTVTGAPVVTATMDTGDWCETLFTKPDAVSYAASARFDYAANAVPYLLAYMSIASIMPMVRAGYNLEYWVKTSIGTTPNSVQLILSKSATCATLDYVTNLSGISPGGVWYRNCNPIGTTTEGLSTMGIKINMAPVVAGSIWLDRMVYTQMFGSAPMLGTDEYNEDLLVLAVRSELNSDVDRDKSMKQNAELEAMIMSHSMNDGAGERPRRLRVRVP